jgi:hypothetical protein
MRREDFVMESRFDAMINGLKCEMTSVEGSESRSIVEHQLVGFDGAALEDCGLERKNHVFETLWANENYDNHFDFLEMFRKGKAYDEIIHPLYGKLIGKIKSVRQVPVSDEIDCIRITVEFVEEGSRSFERNRNLNPKMPKTSDFVLRKELYQRKIPDIQKKVCDSIQSKILKNLRTATSIVRSPIDGLSAKISQMESFVNMSNSMTADFVKAMIFPATIPGRIAKLAFETCCTIENATLDVVMSPNSTLVSFLEEVRLIAQKFKRKDEVFYDAIISAGVYLATFKAEEIFSSVSNAPASAVNNFADRKNIEDTVNTLRREIAQISQNEPDSPLADAGLIIAQKGVETIESMGQEQVFEIKQPTNIYSILMKGRVHRERAFQVCLRNGIENPNRVSGTIYLPEADYEL